MPPWLAGYKVHADSLASQSQHKVLIIFYLPDDMPSYRTAEKWDESAKFVIFAIQNAYMFTYMYHDIKQG